MPALRVVGKTSSLKNGCLIPLYRDAGVTFAQGLFRFDDVNDRDFYDSCADGMKQVFEAKHLHPIILVTVSKTMKKYLIAYGAKITESSDQFVIGGE